MALDLSPSTAVMDTSTRRTPSDRVVVSTCVGSRSRLGVVVFCFFFFCFSSLLVYGSKHEKKSSLSIITLPTWGVRFYTLDDPDRSRR